MQCRQGLSCYCSIFFGTCFIVGIAIVSAGGNTNEAGIGLLAACRKYLHHILSTIQKMLEAFL
jgi:hypothetical protein